MVAQKVGIMSFVYVRQQLGDPQAPRETQKLCVIVYHHFDEGFV